MELRRLEGGSAAVEYAELRTQVHIFQHGGLTAYCEIQSNVGVSAYLQIASHRDARGLHTTVSERGTFNRHVLTDVHQSVHRHVAHNHHVTRSPRVTGGTIDGKLQSIDPEVVLDFHRGIQVQSPVHGQVVEPTLAVHIQPVQGCFAQHAHVCIGVEVSRHPNITGQWSN